ncbi:MAG: S-methyl-5'-thioinosine phosphorylase [gamma proteobacterium symbiont of Taylorina sp.]|nr:S-methyl-5'-thioinosine phosphorylase [gamma proteobacterium symbiont of Taylorina sp.]
MKIAIVGGTGLTSLENLDIIRSEMMNTPFGETSSPLSIGRIDNKEVVFLARHGLTHNIPPHKVNYRANLWALNEVGVDTIIAVNAVGGIREDMVPGSLVVPDQIIDYTTSRSNTFFEDDLTQVTHIDFSYPYSAEIRNVILDSAKNNNINIIDGAVYAATEGPRLETAAEIQRLKQDACDIVGMTGMPEAALARELSIDYASICVNANWAAGLSEQLITMEAIEQTLLEGMEQVRQVIVQILVGQAYD